MYGTVFVSRMARLRSLIKGKKDGGGVCDGSLKNLPSVQTEGLSSYSACEVTHETCSCQIRTKGPLVSEMSCNNDVLCIVIWEKKSSM